MSEITINLPEEVLSARRLHNYLWINCNATGFYLDPLLHSASVAEFLIDFSDLAIARLRR